MRRYNAKVTGVGEELYKLADVIGITHALGCIFGYNIEMTLIIPEELLNANVRTIDLTPRARSAVTKWCGMNAEKPQTVARIVEMIKRGDEVRPYLVGYGKKTEGQLKQRLMEAAWDAMTEEQRKAFCVDLIVKNCYYAEVNDE